MSHPGNYDPYAPDPDEDQCAYLPEPCDQCELYPMSGSDGLCDRCRVFIEYRELREGAPMA